MFDFFKKNNWEWYVIRVVSGTEENVQQSLMQRREAFGLEDYILEVFVPTHDSISVRADWKKIKRRKNIFPGYILVRMIVTNESWYIVRNTPNVTGFLWAWTVPVPVSWEELEQLKGVLTEKNQEITSDLEVWDLALIKNGPFEGSEWKVLEINNKKWTAKIMINLLWRDTPVEVEFASIISKK